jgi:hypothetical protein
VCDYAGRVAQGSLRSRPWGRVQTAVLVLLGAASLAAAAHGTLGAPSRSDRADLSVRSISANPNQVRAAGLLRATITVVNKGKRRGRQTLLGYYLSLDRKRGREDTRLGTRLKLPAMEPGSSYQRSSLLRLPATIPPRSFRLLACADASGRVQEASERNNCRAAARALTVTKPSPGPGPSGAVEFEGSLPSADPGPAPAPAPPRDEPTTPDQTAPNPGFTAPAEGAQTNDSTPQLAGQAGTAPGDSSTVTVEIYAGAIGLGPPVETLTATRAQSGIWSAESPHLSDGGYVARASQLDAAGNSGAATRTFSVDAAGPAVTLHRPADGSWANDPTPAFDGSAGAAAGDESTVTVKIYSGPAVTENAIQTLTATRNGASWSIDAPGLGDGTYTAKAQQSDAAGNTGFSAAHAFTVDTTAPAVTLTSPAEGSSRDATPTLSGLAGDAAGDSSTLAVRVWQGPATTGAPHRTFTTARSGTSWSMNAGELADGTYTARADQGDTAGNTGQSEARTFTIDTTAPAVGLTSPADLSSTADETPTLQGTSSDPGEVTVRIHKGDTTAGALVQTRTAPVSNGSWSVDALPLTEDTYTAQAEQSDAAGNTGRSEARRFSVPATLLAVGDISTCSNDHDEATAALADTLPGTVATLGDNVYQTGTATEFNTCYHPTWGRHKARTRPSVGNHEYEDTAGNAAGYFGYFGAAAGDPDKGYYSYDLGDWHVVVLNSSDNCVTVACGATSPQVQWLRADLDAHPTSCTLAYWHHPRFTSELPDATSVQAFWDVLYEKNADLVLNGHAHNYERYKPQTPTGAVDDARGIRELIVGTGGRSLRPIATQDLNSEIAQWDTYGILKLTLRASSYSWQFVPVAGGTFADSGTTTCH